MTSLIIKFVSLTEHATGEKTLGNTQSSLNKFISWNGHTYLLSPPLLASRTCDDIVIKVWSSAFCLFSQLELRFFVGVAFP